MKRILTAGLISVLFSVLVLSCAGVGGEKLTDEQKEIVLRSLLGSTDFGATYVNEALTGVDSRAVIAGEKGVAIDDNGSTVDYKTGYSCGAVVTLSVLMKAHLVNLSSPVILRPDGNDAVPVQCTAVTTGNFEMKFVTKVFATGSENASIHFRVANSDSDGLKLKVTRDDTGKVVFNAPVFLLFETTYAADSDALSSDVLCKINGEKYDEEWIYDWDFEF